MVLIRAIQLALGLLLFLCGHLPHLSTRLQVAPETVTLKQASIESTISLSKASLIYSVASVAPTANMAASKAARVGEEYDGSSFTAPTPNSAG